MEKMVYDNEVCGMIYRLIKGITVTEETLAVDFIKSNKFDAAGILGADHTFDWFPKEPGKGRHPRQRQDEDQPVFDRCEDAQPIEQPQHVRNIFTVRQFETSL